MLELISPELRPFVGVTGLAGVFLATVSLIHRYRAWQAEKLIRAQRLLRGAEQLERVLMRLQGQSLPRELLDLCRQELLARYRGVQGLFPKIPDLEERIQAAERIRMDHAVATWTAAEAHNAAELKTYTKGLTTLVEILATEWLTPNLDPSRLRELRERVRTLRAEAQSTFHTRAALEFAQAEDWQQAQSEMVRLLDLLKTKAPPTTRCKALYRSALFLYQHLAHRRLPPTDDGPSGAVT